jgi:general secretion pathway protein G
MKKKVVPSAFARRGFTLIELVVVVAILAVLAGILVPLVSGEVDGSRVSRCQMDMKTMSNAFLTYRAHTGVWPSNATGVVTANSNEEIVDYACLFAAPTGINGWKGPYLNDGFKTNGTWKVAGAQAGEGFRDPWGNPYLVYWFKNNSTAGAGGGIMLVSKGPNGALNSSTAKIAAGDSTGDDVVYVVARKV